VRWAWHVFKQRERSLKEMLTAALGCSVAQLHSARLNILLTVATRPVEAFEKAAESRQNGDILNREPYLPQPTQLVKCPKIPMANCRHYLQCTCVAERLILSYTVFLSHRMLKQRGEEKSCGIGSFANGCSAMTWWKDQSAARP
jgi:hypothetical protein